MNKNAVDGKRPLIALISNQYIDFQKNIATKLALALEQEGYGLICVSAGALEPAPGTRTANLAARNAFYEVARNYDVAGFVILTVTIGNHAKANQLVKFVKQFSHKPVVSFGVDVPGTASVTINNRDSMSELMEHMTQDPARKRFAFIRGYPNMPDSAQRESVFKDTLTRKQIPVDESLIVDGNFMTADSYFAMDELLQTTRDIDAVVAGSDRMALSAVHALLNHGLRVPEDVIVSGFDDGLSSNSSLPPLTTVAYSMTERVKLTVDSLLSQIASGVFEEPSRGPVHCKTTLVIRESSESAAQADASKSTDQTRLFNAKQFQASILKELSTLKNPAAVNVAEMVDDIVSILVNGASESSTNLEAALRGLRKHPEDIYWWRHLHYQIGSKLQRYGTVGQSPQALSLISKMLSQIHETLWNVEASLNFEEARYQELQFRLRLNLSASVNMQELTDTLTHQGNRFEGLTAFLCLYDKPGIKPDSQSRLAYQYPADLMDFPDDQLFPTKDILPQNALNTILEGPYIIEPLCTGVTQLGYMVIDISNPKFTQKLNTTALADNISGALWRLLSTDENLG